MFAIAEISHSTMIRWNNNQQLVNENNNKCTNEKDVEKNTVSRTTRTLANKRFDTNESTQLNDKAKTKGN